MKIRVQEFIDEVINGTRPHCKWVKLAVKRYLDDLEHGAERGLYFDEDAARYALDFFDYCKHSKGEWAGKTLELEPWQQFQIWNIFGWKKEKDNCRRFNTVYDEEPRKNGKSTKMAAIGLYMFIADGEAGAEVYVAATKRDQALIIFDESVRMVKKSPQLNKLVKNVKNNMSIISTASKFEPLGADKDTLDGLNMHCGIIDELHAHKTRGVWDVLDTATGSRQQALIAAITTAGYDKTSICWEQHEYAEKVLQGIIQDDTFFCMIFTIDDEDIKAGNYFDEEVWRKANPNYGISVKPDDFKKVANKAKELPSQLNTFLRLKLNVWTQAESRWFAMEKWDACAGEVKEEELIGKPCFTALDLSSTDDITAMGHIFPFELDKEIELEIEMIDENGELEKYIIKTKYKYKILTRFFLPEAAINARVKKARVPYDVWGRDGYIIKTPGNVLDYAYVLKQFDDDAQKFNIREVAYDRWGAIKIIPEMSSRGMTVVPFGQGFKDMSPASKEFERLLLSRTLEHGNNPVLNWMASNVVVEQDSAGNIKPSKLKSSEKIDGMITTVMGIGRCVGAGEIQSVYEDRGVIVFG